MSLGGDEWLEILRREYLDDYVPSGGSAVKFAVVAEREAGDALVRSILASGSDAGFLTAKVDSAQTRIHMMQDLFFDVAGQVEWGALARAFVRRSYEEDGFAVPDGDLRAESVAALNGVEVSTLRASLRHRMEDVLRRSDELAKDFRIAMLWLCLAELSAPASEGHSSGSEGVQEWLRGDLRLISALRRFLIFRKIGRHNARAMLSSLSAWSRLAGHQGLVLVLDVRQLAIPRRPEAQELGHYYTPAAVMDAYEVLRQLIDATDDLVGMLCVVLADPALFDDDRRGVKVYKALYERVWPDVRLRQRPNPLSSMAELSGAGVGE